MRRAESFRHALAGAAVLIFLAAGAAGGCASAERTASSPPSPPNPWAQQRTPFVLASSLQPRSIGGTGAGCLAGAEALGAAGTGFQPVRLSRNRHFGHPSLVRFLRAIAAEAAKEGLAYCIGDLSMPRGGPMLTGHASHQTGLDADIWIWQTPEPAIDGENTEAPLAANPATFAPIRGIWTDSAIRALELVALRPEVERIFINPILKQDLCVRPQRPRWLGKLRPWWGHDRHFHVRLRCPEGEALCRAPKEPVPPGDGCDATLSWWFSEEARALARESEEKPRTLPELPPECAPLLQDAATVIPTSAR